MAGTFPTILEFGAIKLPEEPSKPVFNCGIDFLSISDYFEAYYYDIDGVS